MPSISQPDRPVVWTPIPGSSQEFALDTRAMETLYTGSRGPGKSDTQLMRFKRRVGVGYGKFWRGIIFDREYKHLDDLVSKSKRWFPEFRDGAHFHESTASYKWTWPTGEELLFRVFKKLSDYDNYHGQEYPFIGWNELTKYPTMEPYDLMMSCNRSSFTPEKDSPRDARGRITTLLPDIPLEVFSTCNSWGTGRNWVKINFIDPAPYGKIQKTTRQVFNPKTQKEEEFVTTRVAIFGSYKENIYLSPQYIAQLEDIKDPNLRESWLRGSWDVTSGGAIDDCWDRRYHVIPRFQIPDNWYIDRSFDWGSTHPFSVGWWAEATGETVPLRVNGKIYAFTPNRGSLIKINEWYGTQKLGGNKGLKLSGGAIAEGIRERETEFMRDGWIPYQPWPGPADNQIRNVTESDVDTIEKKMADKGVRWQTSDKSKGSRKNGLELIRERLTAVTKGEGPGLYFMNNCIASIATIPVLPRSEDDNDDVDTEAEDHAYDECRYRVLKGSNRSAKSIKVEYAT